MNIIDIIHDSNFFKQPKKTTFEISVLLKSNSDNSNK